MPKNPQEFAELLGARIVGEVPDVGGGPFGMARLAHLLHERLTPSEGERAGRPTDATWESRPKVPMSEATLRRLAEIAEAISTPQRRVSPMQLAAHLLEEAVGCIDAREKAGQTTEDAVENPVPSEKASGRTRSALNAEHGVSEDADTATTPRDSAGQAVAGEATAKRRKSRREQRGTPGRRQSKA